MVGWYETVIIVLAPSKKVERRKYPNLRRRRRRRFAEDIGKTSTMSPKARELSTEDELKISMYLVASTTNVKL